MTHFTPDNEADTVLVETIVRALMGAPLADDRNTYWQESARLTLEIQIRVLLTRKPDLNSDIVEVER